MMNLSIEDGDETQEDLCTLLWTFLLLVMVISTLQIYFLHICINGVQLRNANRIGTERMLAIFTVIRVESVSLSFQLLTRYF